MTQELLYTFSYVFAVCNIRYPPPQGTKVTISRCEGHGPLPSLCLTHPVGMWLFISTQHSGATCPHASCSHIPPGGVITITKEVVDKGPGVQHMTSVVIAGVFETSSVAVNIDPYLV